MKITYTKAKALGRKHYFSDKPCRFGHTTARYTIGRQCVACCQEEKRKWRHEHAMAALCLEAESQASTRENFSRIIAISNRRKNPRRRQLERFNTPPWSDRQICAAIRRQARELGFHVDHTVPLVSTHVSGLNAHTNLQLMPRAENSRKSNRWWPDMPDVLDRSVAYRGECARA